MTSLVGAYGQKLWELVKNTSMYDPYFGVDEIVVSADTWAKVPPPLQQKLNMLLQKWVGRESMYAYHSQRNDEIMKEAKEKYGAKFTTPSPEFTAQMREKCSTLLEAYVKDGGEMAKQSMDLLKALK
jgi:TRAP-type C4-dicarboxylate transport system substrate-binding protein